MYVVYIFLIESENDFSTNVIYFVHIPKVLMNILGNCTLYQFQMFNDFFLIYGLFIYGSLYLYQICL